MTLQSGNRRFKSHVFEFSFNYSDLCITFWIFYTSVFQILIKLQFFCYILNIWLLQVHHRIMQMKTCTDSWHIHPFWGHWRWLQTDDWQTPRGGHHNSNITVSCQKLFILDSSLFSLQQISPSMQFCQKKMWSQLHVWAWWHALLSLVMWFLEHAT